MLREAEGRLKALVVGTLLRVSETVGFFFPKGKGADGHGSQIDMRQNGKPLGGLLFLLP